MEQRNPRLRWLVVWVLAVVWMAVVLGRLSYLQLFSYSEYLAKAQRQQQRIFEISPMRGTIYDRKGRELAVSLPMDSVFGDPAEITDVEMVARLLSRVLDVPAEDLEEKIREAKTPVRLARKLSPETVQRITDMNLKGVFFQKENRRVYPQRELAASVLGYVDVDEKGIGGIEYSLDKQIRGRPGKMMVMADGRRRWYDRHGIGRRSGRERDADDRRNDSVHRGEGTGARHRGDAREGRHGRRAGSELGRTAGGRQLARIRSQRCGRLCSLKRAWTARWRPRTSRDRRSR